MLLKEKIEKFKNKKINIDDVLMNDLGNCIYSINHDMDELKELFSATNFNEKIYMFKNIFCYNFGKNKNADPEKLKESLYLFIENDFFGKIIHELMNIRKETILNILPLLSEDDLKKNMNWLWRDINILNINSNDIRKIYFNEYEMNTSSDNNLFENITDSVFWSILNNEEKIDSQMLNNITETIKLINVNSEGFIEQAKRIYPDSYNEEIMNLFALDIEGEKLISEEVIKEYTHFIIKNIKSENIDLEDIIFPEDIDYILNNMNPFIFECILDEFVNNKNKLAINKLIEMYIDSPQSKTGLNENKYIKNKNCLFEKKALMEKVELLDNFQESNNKSDIKKRL